VKNPPTIIATAAPAPEHELRGEVRRQLSTMPGERAASVGYLTKQINKTTPLVCDEGMVQKALDWNHDRGFVDYRYNTELEWDEWFLTERGKRQEGLK
jgi:hypothetical protein